jgi:hypothetical protein
MRLIFILTLSTYASVWGQTDVFDLSNLESKKFKSFLSQKEVIVVGEMHGTTEVPQLVLRLAKLIREDEKSLTVALEIESNLQPQINTFMKTGEFEKLFEYDYFKWPDGRSSMAIGELMKGLRNLGSVKIVCFDADRGLGSDINRDSIMAINLADSFTYGKMIVLTGNVHANLKAGYWRPDFKSAIYHFKRMKNLNEQLVSLNTYFDDGTIWNCMKDGCKERPAHSNPGIDKKSGLTDFIAVNEIADGSGYDGFVYFQNVTASKPLVE